MIRFILPLLLFLFLSACSGFGSAPEAPKGPGSILTGKDEQGIKIGEIFSGSNTSTGLPINAILWRASLDIVSPLPIDDVDAFGGSIVSEWYAVPETPNDRIKLSIFVLSQELRSDGIRVVVNTQNRASNGDWIDGGIDEELSRKLEELILTRAREIRAETIGEN